MHPTVLCIVSGNECTLSREQIMQLVDIVNVQDVVNIVFKFRALVKPLHGSGGVLYRIGDHAIIEDISNVDTVLKFTAFYCIPIGSDFYTLCM